MFKYYRSLPIRNKIFLTFASSFIIFITIIVLIVYWSNVNEMKKQTQSMSEVLSSQFSRTIDLYFKDIERISLAVFTDTYIQDILSSKDAISIVDDISIRNNMFLRLFNHVYPHSNIEGITIYNNDGMAFDYKRNRNLEVKYFPTTDSWREELDQYDKNTILFLAPTEINKSNGEKLQVVSLVRNIYSIPRKEKIGAMKIDINVEVFLKLLETENINELEQFMRILILDNQEKVIFDQMRELIGKQAQVDLNTIQTNNKKEDLLNWDSRSFIYANTRSEFTGWNALVLVDNEFIASEQRQMLLFLLFSAMIAIFIIAMISYFLSFNITKPFLAIIEKMKRVESGDFTNRMKETGNPEMDVLTGVYNSMLKSINKLITEVYEASIAEKNAQISALQSQINPHFLYNTLNIMKSISRVKGVEEVAEISESLSDLFKYSLMDSDKPVSLQKELEHIDNYILILQHRFRDRFIFIKHISEEAKRIKIPKLLIQPLIENAVNHGLKNKHADGKIVLRAFLEKDHQIIEVTDNGIGMDGETLSSVKKGLQRRKVDERTKGIGLNNISQRLRLLYGYRYKIIIESEVNRGTTVRILLPREQEEDT